MATKPVTLPQAWGVGPNWTTGPFIGSPVKSDPGVGIAADGHRPGSNFPTAAEHENFQQFQVTKWVRDWLFAGSSLGLPDAHIVETNATGRATLHGLDVDNNVDETALNVRGVNTLAPTALFFCDTGATVVQSDVGASSGTAFAASLSGSLNTPNGLSVSMFDLGDSGSNAGVKIVADAATDAVGLRIDHAGTNEGLHVSATGSAPAANLFGSALSSSGVTITGAINQALLVTAAGALRAIEAVGSNLAGAVSVRGRTLHADGVAFDVSLGGAPSANARGYRANVGGSAIAAEFIASGNYPLQLQGDTTSPSFSEVKFVGQNARTAVTFDGGLQWNTTERQFTRTSATAAGSRGIHDSVGGWCHGFDFVSAPTSALAAYQTAASAVMTGDEAPKFAGTVEVTVTFTPRVQVLGVTTLDYEIQHNGVTFYSRTGAGNGATAGIELPGATTNWQPAHTVTVPRAVAAGPSTFTLRVKNPAGSGIVVRDASVRVTGVY